MTAKDYFTRSIVQGALAGAALGAGAGALIGATTRANIGESMLVGALAGGALGATANYFQARQKQAQDQRQLASLILTDVRQESTEIDRATVTFLKVRQCRFVAAERIKAAFNAGRLPRQEAERQLNDQRTRFEQELQYARSIGAQMAKRGEDFRLAATDLHNTVAPGTPMIVQPAPPAPVATRAASEPSPKRRHRRKSKQPSEPVAPPPAPAQPAVSSPPSPQELSQEVAKVATLTNAEKRASYDSAVAAASTDQQVVFDLNTPAAPPAKSGSLLLQSNNFAA